MENRRTLAIVLLVPFTLLTLYAVMHSGYDGIIAHALDGPAGWQIFADLVVALVLVLVWLLADARRTGRNPWPWVIVTLLLGSFGPLLYLAVGGTTSRLAERD